ncbi:hypothetical protein BGZ47_010367, partial [Haplosporangium gracile]
MWSERTLMGPAQWWTRSRLSGTDAEFDAASDAESVAAPDAMPDAESKDDEPDVESEDDKPSPIALTFTSTGLQLAVGFNDGTVNI